MELLERERCLADLTAWLVAVATRGGCIALLGGEAGIGKSSLLHEFCNRQRHARVLWGACDALFTPRPLSPLHDIARRPRLPFASRCAHEVSAAFHAARVVDHHVSSILTKLGVQSRAEAIAITHRQPDEAR